MTTTDQPVSDPSDLGEPVDPAALVPLEEQCEWRRDELGNGYVFELTDDHVAELDAALAEAEAAVDDVLDITRDHFPLPTLGAELEAITHQLIDGRGVVLIRGLPAHRLSKDRASAMYWSIGTHLGRPWPQNARGHLLGDVTDQGKGYDDPTSRGNEIGGVPFPFHSDGSDLVGLMCLDPGVCGGASLVANAVTIHNELVRTDPELAAELYGLSRTTCGANRLPVRGPGTRCRCAAGGPSDCSCATSAPTSTRPVAMKTRQSCRRRQRRPSTGSTPCAPMSSTTSG